MHIYVDPSKVITLMKLRGARPLLFIKLLFLLLQASAVGGQGLSEHVRVWKSSAQSHGALWSGTSSSDFGIGSSVSIVFAFHLQLLSFSRRYKDWASAESINP